MLKLNRIQQDEDNISNDYTECIKGPLKQELCKGLDAMDLRPSAHQVSQLAKYLEYLNKWNKVYNLTAIRDINEMLVQHLFDCLAIVRPIQNMLRQKQLIQHESDSIRAMDVGSGAGLPAAVLAIMNPAWQVTAVDAVNKKMAFVQQQAAVLGLKNLSAQHARIENIQTKEQHFITSRAFSSLVDFVTLSQDALSSQGVWCAMKGKEPTEELHVLQQKLGHEIDVFHVEHIQVPAMDAQRCLVWMKRKNQ